MSHSVSQRSAEVLPDGRVRHRALIRAGDAGYYWDHTCDGCDHVDVEREIRGKLQYWNDRTPELHALVGHSERVGLVRFTVTDANIQIHGPRKWTVYLAWDEEPVTHVSYRIHRDYSVDQECPSRCMTAGEALATIRNQVANSSNRLARGIRAAGEFMSG